MCDEAQWTTCCRSWTREDVDYDNRILFEFVQNSESGEEEIHLLTMGTHNEVY